MPGEGFTSRNDRFLRAGRLQAVDRAPVWLMRQAGLMEEHRAIRSRHGREVLEAHARDISDPAGGRGGHSFNPGHGILTSTPVDAVRRLIDIVHNHRPSNPSHSA